MRADSPGRSTEEEARGHAGETIRGLRKGRARRACERFADVAPPRRRWLRPGLTPHRSMGRKPCSAASLRTGARKACERRADGAAARRRWWGSFGWARPEGPADRAPAGAEGRESDGWLGLGQYPRLGSARLGSARLGSARLGSARLGSARLGSALNYTFCGTLRRERMQEIVQRRSRIAAAAAATRAQRSAMVRVSHLWGLRPITSAPF